MQKDAKTVLIVDDEQSIVKALTFKLRYEGLLVLEAKDGIEGLEMALKYRPQLILLDILMPRMDGETMLKKLRQDPVGKTIPVILLTNLGEPEGITEALKLMASDYLIKSDWNLDDVVKRINEELAVKNLTPN